MDLTEFYPTPPHLIEKMIDGIDLGIMDDILEPSAGKGNIVDVIIKKLSQQNPRCWTTRTAKSHIDCVEMAKDLQRILEGKEYRVVHDDFLSYETFKRYDLIVMNPPFSKGADHLLHALDLMKTYGGEIRCILNAETIKNPYTNTRQRLIRKLSEFGASIDYYEDQFVSAERSTSVEIALIKVTVPASYEDSLIIDDLKRAAAVEGMDVRDILWVKETWNGDWCDHVIYKADGGSAKEAGYLAEPKWRPSIHMPKEAARLFLRVNNVRAERLQDISEDDARSEGITRLYDNLGVDEFEDWRSRLSDSTSIEDQCKQPYTNYLWHGHFGKNGMGNKQSDSWEYQRSGYESARGSFSSLWEKINASCGYGWDMNPWVWVYTFERTEKP